MAQEIDKTRAVIEYLLGLAEDDNGNKITDGCEVIKNNKLFFNFLEAKDNSKQFVTLSNDKATNRTYIDGSVQKRFTFTIIDYRSVVYQAMVKQVDYIDKNENFEEYLDIQGIIDWISEQSDLHNYPNFGKCCIIDNIRTTTENPNLNGVDTSVSPALAKYSMSIQVDYLDISKCNWNK